MHNPLVSHNNMHITLPRLAPAQRTTAKMSTDSKTKDKCQMRQAAKKKRELQQPSVHTHAKF